MTAPFAKWHNFCYDQICSRWCAIIVFVTMESHHYFYWFSRHIEAIDNSDLVLSEQHSVHTYSDNIWTDPPNKITYNIHNNKTRQLGRPRSPANRLFSSLPHVLLSSQWPNVKSYLVNDCPIYFKITRLVFRKSELVIVALNSQVKWTKNTTKL